MKVKSIMLVMALIIFGIGSYGYTKAIPKTRSQGEDAPEIGVIPNSFDFGQLQYGSVAEHTFEVTNTGESVLDIKRISTSCGCTTAKISNKQIPPGGQAELVVSYDTGAMSGYHARGKQERIIYIKSNDPINPQMEALIYADVK